MATASTAALNLPGPGTGVLLFHGFTGSPYELTPLAHALAARGCSVRVPLLPGHGTTPEDLSRQRWDDFYGAALEALHTHDAPWPYIVGGLSMGALIALELAANPVHRARIRGVLTYGCALRFTPWVTAALRAMQSAGGRMPDLYAPKKGLDVQDPVVQAESPSYRTRPLRASRELLVGQARVRAGLAGIGAPVLAFHGLMDRTCPLEGSLDVVRGVASTDVSLVVLPRSGHQVTIDRDRESVARQSVDFVARLG